MELGIINIDKSLLKFDGNALHLSFESFFYDATRKFGIKYKGIRKLNLWLTMDCPELTKEYVHIKHITKIEISNYKGNLNSPKEYRNYLVQSLKDIFRLLDVITKQDNFDLLENLFQQCWNEEGDFELEKLKKKRMLNKTCSVIAKYKVNFIHYFMKVDESNGNFYEIELLQGQPYNIYISNLLYRLEVKQNCALVSSLLREIVFIVDTDTKECHINFQEKISNRPVSFLKRVFNAMQKNNLTEQEMKYLIFMGVPGGVDSVSRV